MTNDEILQDAKEATNNQPIYGRKEFTFSAEELQRFAAIDSVKENSDGH